MSDNRISREDKNAFYSELKYTIYRKEALNKSLTPDDLNLLFDIVKVPNWIIYFAISFLIIAVLLIWHFYF